MKARAREVQRAAAELILAQDQVRLLVIAERFGMDVEVTTADVRSIGDAADRYDAARAER